MKKWLINMVVYQHKDMNAGPELEVIVQFYGPPCWLFCTMAPPSVVILVYVDILFLYFKGRLH